MKRLILVRHGEYGGEDNGLTNAGEQQITQLGIKLKATVNVERITILTSVAPRARDSAEILGEILEVPFEEHEVFWSEKGRREDMPKALELIRSKKNEADIIILVTHHEYVQKFPRYFEWKELDDQDTFPYQSLKNGEAWDIDCKQKTISRIYQ